MFSLVNGIGALFLVSLCCGIAVIRKIGGSSVFGVFCVLVLSLQFV